MSAVPAVGDALCPPATFPRVNAQRCCHFTPCPTCKQVGSISHCLPRLLAKLTLIFSLFVHHLTGISVHHFLRLRRLQIRPNIRSSAFTPPCQALHLQPFFPTRSLAHQCPSSHVQRAHSSISTAAVELFQLRVTVHQDRTHGRCFGMQEKLARRFQGYQPDFSGEHRGVYSVKSIA
ncbi:hypothetical protein EDB19DRAFT_674346 [Suillus lakei]|nr:hypothetical protein EDB19DRAFT_674346 [Suillus lakei]